MIEAALYLTIFSVILIAVVQFGFILGGSRNKFLARSSVHDDADRLLNLIDFFVRNSDGYVTDSSGQDCYYDSNSLSLYFGANSGDYIPPGCEVGAVSYSQVALVIETDSGGVRAKCYHNYPTAGYPVNCSDWSAYTSSSTVKLSNNVQNFIDDNGLFFSTSTINARTAVKTELIIGYRDAAHPDFQASTTATSTAVFRID